MTGRPRIGVLLGEGSIGVQDLLEGACGWADIVVLLHPRSRPTPEVCRAVETHFPTVDLATEPGVDADVGLTAITTFSDLLIVPAIATAQRLGLPAMSAAAGQACSDKLWQRKLLRAGGCEVPEFADADDASARRRLGEHRSPVCGYILKPREGSASVGIRSWDDPSPLAHPGYLIERIIDHAAPLDVGLGDYASVEIAAVDEDRISVVGITGRFPVDSRFRETGAVIHPGIPESFRASLESEAERAVRSLGVWPTVSHVEMKLTSPRPTIIEVNGRVGGHLRELYRDCAHLDLAQVALTTAAGRTPVGLGERPTIAGALLVVQPPPEAVTVRQLPSIRALLSIPGVTSVRRTLGPGDRVDKQAGTEGRLAEIAIRAPGIETVVAARQAVVAVFAEQAQYDD